MIALKTVKYKVSLTGLGTPKGTITFDVLRSVVDVLSKGSERALRLAVEGGSVRTGPTPAWLARSTNFVLSGIRKGSTQLIIGAPTLSEVAHKQIQQQDFWYNKPSPHDTAITVFARSVHDAESAAMESENYDVGVLDTILGFRDLFVRENVRLSLESPQRADEFFQLERKSLDRIQTLRKKTPEPQTVLVTGFFDAIEHSKKGFQLALKDGQIVRGRVVDGTVSLEDMRSFWGKEVTVRGVLHVMASGKPRLLEAQVINMRGEGDQILEQLQLPVLADDLLAQPRTQLAANKNLATDIWGKWPGDESVEEILAALRAGESAN